MTPAKAGVPNEVPPATWKSWNGEFRSQEVDPFVLASAWHTIYMTPFQLLLAKKEMSGCVRCVYATGTTPTCQGGIFHPPLLSTVFVVGGQVFGPLALETPSTQLLGPPLPPARSNPLGSTLVHCDGKFVAQTESSHGVSGTYDCAERPPVPFVRLQY